MATAFTEEDGLEIYRLDRNLNGSFFSVFTQKDLKKYYTDRALDYWAKLPMVHRIVVFDDVEKLKEIIHKPDLINQKDEMKRTPFWYACSPHSKKCFELLLKEEPMVDITSEASTSPLHRICLDGTCEMLKAYLTHVPKSYAQKARDILGELMFLSAEHVLMKAYLRI